MSLQKDDWVEIKNIGEVVSGSTPKTTNESYWGGENKWITPAELSSNTYVITKTDRYLTDEGVKSCSLRKLPKDTVLLTSRAPIGKVAIAGTEMYCNQGFKNIICNEKIRPKYLFYLLKNNVRYLEYLGRGATFKEISKSIVENVKIPLFPLQDQDRFIEFAEQIDKSKFLLQQILKKLELLKKSRFIELFGSTDLSLQKDDWVEIKNIGEVVSGSTPKTTNESYWGGENKWITPAELSSNTYVITKTDRYLTDEGVKSCSLRKLPKDTVLLTSRAPIGKVAIAGTEMYCNQGFKNIICNEKIRPKYLFYLLKNNVRYLEYLGRGATFKEISKSIVENVKIPLFPLQDQDRFIEFAEQIDKSKFNVFQDQTAAQVKVIVVLHHIC